MHERCRSPLYAQHMLEKAGQIPESWSSTTVSEACGHGRSLCLLLQSCSSRKAAACCQGLGAGQHCARGCFMVGRLAVNGHCLPSRCSKMLLPAPCTELSIIPYPVP